MIEDLLDVVLLDIGGTLVRENAPGTPIDQLMPTLLPRVLDDLTELSRTVRLGAATNTSVMNESIVRSLLAKVGIDHLLEVVVTSYDVGAAKPDPLVLLEANRRLGQVDPSRVLYVGDRSTDQDAAFAARMHFTYVTERGVLAVVQEWVSSNSEHA